VLGKTPTLKRGVVDNRCRLLLSFGSGSTTLPNDDKTMVGIYFAASITNKKEK
jgi:hypothetical protein